MRELSSTFKEHVIMKCPHMCNELKDRQMWPNGNSSAASHTYCSWLLLLIPQLIPSSSPNMVIGATSKQTAAAANIMTPSSCMWSHVSSCELMWSMVEIMWAHVIYGRDHVSSWSRYRSCELMWVHVSSFELMWFMVQIMWAHVIYGTDHVSSCDLQHSSCELMWSIVQTSMGGHVTMQTWRIPRWLKNGSVMSQAMK